MQNWIGIGIWIVMGGLLGLASKLLVSLPKENPGHTTLLVILGALGSVVGGMLGVGLLQFYEPNALSLGGMIGALVLGLFMASMYRWSIKSLT